MHRVQTLPAVSFRPDAMTKSARSGKSTTGGVTSLPLLRPASEAANGHFFRQSRGGPRQPMAAQSPDCFSPPWPACLPSCLTARPTDRPTATDDGAPAAAAALAGGAAAAVVQVRSVHRPSGRAGKCLPFPSKMLPSLSVLHSPLSLIFSTWWRKRA